MPVVDHRPAPPAPTRAGPGRGWEELRRTAGVVEAAASNGPAGSGRPVARRALVTAVALVAAMAAARGGAGHPHPASADGNADADLFSLTNQDRASNGLGALALHGTLQSIGENYAYSGCGFPVSGRSFDMVNRNFFSHTILNCGSQNVFNMMSAAGVPYRSAGENIGWTGGISDPASAANYVNQSFMNSPEHRANILNGTYTHLGIGSDHAANWSYPGGGTYSNVWMFSEEFAQLASSPPPPPPPPPTRPPPAPPPPAPRPGQPVRNEPAPTPPPGSTDATSPPIPASPGAPTAESTPAPSPEPSPVAGGTAGAETPTGQPLVWSDSGLLGGAVEAVLEAYLN